MDENGFESLFDIDPQKIRRPKVPRSLVTSIVGGIAALVVLMSTFYQVQPEEVGVILRFGEFIKITEPGLHTLMAARVIVVGMGGVGSFAAEALARSAVGKLVLIDFDDICVTNTNRQIHTTKGVVGDAKVDVMAARCRLINPRIRVDVHEAFYSAEAYHQEYYENNPNQGYCRVVIQPKVEKFEKVFSDLLK